MELKKSKKANIEQWKGIFFTVGLILALSVLIYAFELKTKSINVSLTDSGLLDFAEVDVDITKRNKPEVKKVIPAPTTEFILVKNNKNVDMRDLLIVPDEWPDDWNTVEIETTEEELEFEPFYPFPQVPTVFPGNLEEYLMKNTVYPPAAKEAGIQGTVYVRFKVDSHGKVKNVVTARGVHQLLDDEAERVIRQMPDWKPAVQGDRNVATEMVIPIKFKLKD